MRLTSKKAEQAIKRILEDISKKYVYNLVLCSKSKNYRRRDGRLVDSKFIAKMYPYIDGPLALPLVIVPGNNASYIKLFKKMLEVGLEIEKSNVLDIKKLYGSTYEEIMMNLDLNDVE